MDIRQLELFLAVMEQRSVTRAAERVYLSPSAVSLQLHNLAIELHADLFVRSGKRFLPTPAAERLAELAKDVVRQVRAIEQEFARDPAHDVRPFHLGTGATKLIHRLGRPLRLLRKQYPNMQIQVTVSATEEMVAGLLDRRYDLAVISLPFEEPSLSILPLFDEELLVIKPSAKASRSCKVRDIAPEELASAKFLFYPTRSNMRTIVEGFFRDINIAPQVVMEADDTEVIKKLVETGFGYSICLNARCRTGRVISSVPRARSPHSAAAGAGDDEFGVSARAYPFDCAVFAICFDAGRSSRLKSTEAARRWRRFKVQLASAGAGASG